MSILKSLSIFSYYGFIVSILQESHEWHSALAKFNDESDRLYIVDANFDLGLIFSDSKLASATGIISVLNKANKENVPHFKTNVPNIRLIWQTFFKEVPRDKAARGFRILTYPSGRQLKGDIIHFWGVRQFFFK